MTLQPRVVGIDLAKRVFPQLITPQFVKPYVKSNKNDPADAEGRCCTNRPEAALVPCTLLSADEKGLRTIIVKLRRAGLPARKRGGWNHALKPQCEGL